LEDLKNKKLKVLHNNSFIDDPTRIVRGLKFRIRFGFKLDEHTAKLQNDYLSNINYDMSYKRLKKELVETFNLNSDRAFAIFLEEGIYKLLSDKSTNLSGVNIEQYVKDYNPQCVWIIYAGLLPDISALPLTKTEKKIADDYNSVKSKKFNSDIEIYNTFCNMRTESIIMYAAAQSSAPAIRYLDYLSKIKLNITGKDLLELGLRPSDMFRQCFEYVLDQKFKSPEMDKSAELQEVKNFIEQPDIIK